MKENDEGDESNLSKCVDVTMKPPVPLIYANKNVKICI
jgi:hypothetical protein